MTFATVRRVAVAVLLVALFTRSTAAQTPAADREPARQTQAAPASAPATSDPLNGVTFNVTFEGDYQYKLESAGRARQRPARLRHARQHVRHSAGRARRRERPRPSNFSRAYLFNFLPFYHSGLRAQFPITDRVTVMYMLTNGIQQTEDFNNFKSNHLAAVITPANGVSWTVNYYFGQEQPDGGEPDGPDGWFRVFDTYITYAPNNRLSIGADVNHVTSEVHQIDPAGVLNGFGGYARYQASPKDAVAVRYEWIDDDGGLFGGVSQTLQEVTFTVERKVAGGFLVRGEFRRDWSNTAFFPGRRSTDTLETAQNTALVGLVWWVGGKKGVW